MIRREPSEIKLTDDDLKDWRDAKQAILNEKQRQILSRGKKSGGTLLANEFDLQAKLEERNRRIGLK